MIYKTHSNKRKMKGIEAFATSIDAGITMYDNVMSYPVSDAKTHYDFKGSLIVKHFN